MTHRSEPFLASEVTRAYVEREFTIVDGIQRSLDDIEARRTVSHDKALTELGAIIGNRT